MSESIEIVVEYNNDDKPESFKDVYNYTVSSNGTLSIIMENGTSYMIPPYGMKKATIYRDKE